MEKYARNLPLHLIAVIMDWEMDKSTFKYLLCGILLLHSMFHLASRVPKIEQLIGSQTVLSIIILLDDVKISEQLIDLVFYLLVLLGPYRHVSIHFLEILVLSSVVCRYVLTTSYPRISHHTQWHGSSSFGSGSLYYKIVSPHYQEVDIFIEAEFAAVCVDVKFLQTNDSFGSAFPTTEETLNHICQSVILLFNFYSPCLLHLCEAESVSYLEEVASKTSTQDVAKSVGLKVLVSKVKASFSSGSCVAKKMFNAPSEASYPKGQLELNAMRLADVLSDDSNFLSFIMINFVSFPSVQLILKF
ncbi:hypothetical protein SASPL_120837 [Salvia splendens]|uniref:Nodulin homeobox N-terminal domain-containing protein n=1 Tax=Salvia splendens TaxID=180675 RepID=A0A8X8ZVN3_SALSN|nr:hypothetical protein SASPL_120837 [Salvia splendens]